MITPRNRFTVTPFLVAFFTALVNLPALTVVKVNAFGMGLEHEQPWRRPSNGLLAPLALARRTLKQCAAAFGAIHRHALFRPALLASLALLVALSRHDGVASLLAVGALAEGRHAAEFLIGERADLASRENGTVLSGQNLKAGAVIGRVKYGIGRVSIPTVVGTGNGTVSVVFAGPEAEVGNYVLTCTAAVADGGVFSLTTPGGKTLPALTMTPGAGGTTVYTSRHINFSITDGSTNFVAADVFTFVVSTTAPTVIGGTGTGVMTALSLGPDAKPGRYQVINRVVVTNGGDFEVIGPDGASIGRFIWANAGSTAAFTSRQVNFTLSDATDYIANNYFDIAVFNNLAGGKIVAWDPATFDGRDDVAGVLLDNVDATSGDLAGVIVTNNAVVLKGSLEWAATITSSQKESAYLDLAARRIVAR